MNVTTPDFWVALAQIFMIDLVLSGDNAVVIALACRNLPEEQRRLGILAGVAGAVSARTLLTVFAATLLVLPWVKLIGAVLLLWIGAELIAEKTATSREIKSHDRLWSAIWTIVAADVVMSIDNVVGVAAAARGNVFLLVLGLLISIPIVVFGSGLVMRLLQRIPVLVAAAGGLLGYIAGDLGTSDPVLARVIGSREWINILAPVIGFVVVVAVGLAQRRLHRKAAR